MGSRREEGRWGGTFARARRRDLGGTADMVAEEGREGGVRREPGSSRIEYCSTGSAIYVLLDHRRSRLVKLPLGSRSFQGRPTRAFLLSLPSARTFDDR
jgi:hypothetical protein